MGTLHSFGNDNIVVCVAVVLGLRLITGILYGFAIIIVIIVEVAGVLILGFVLGMLYDFVLVLDICLEI